MRALARLRPRRREAPGPRSDIGGSRRFKARRVATRSAARYGLLAVLGLIACASAPRPAPSPVIYFALTDRFEDGDLGNDANVYRAAPGAYHGGDLAGLRARLPYLKRLGVDILWISPVVDNIDEPVSGAGFPDWGYHGYWAKDFERMDEHQGTVADLRALVREAHAAGMRVLLDVVVNHPGYGAPLAADPAWTRSPARGDCGHDPLTECLLGLPDFRTEDARVADYLIAAHIGWARRSDVDGFRVDSVRHVSREVLARLVAAARALRPGFFVLAEAWGASPLADDAEDLAVFDALFDFSFADEALAFAQHGGAARLGAYLEARGARASRYVVFLDSHDTPGFLFRAGGDRGALILGAVLEMTVPGMPLVYYGDEVARRGGDWPQNRGDMPWDGGDHEVLERYRQLIAARRHLDGPLRVLAVDGAALAFSRGRAVVALNAGQTPARLRVPHLPPRDLLGWGAKVTSADVYLPARSAAVLVP